LSRSEKNTSYQIVCPSPSKSGEEIERRSRHRRRRGKEEGVLVHDLIGDRNGRDLGKTLNAFRRRKEYCLSPWGEGKQLPPGANNSSFRREKKGTTSPRSRVEKKYLQGKTITWELAYFFPIEKKRGRRSWDSKGHRRDRRGVLLFKRKM